MYNYIDIINEDIYYGEEICSETLKSGKRKNENCTNKAYYTKHGIVYCGMHCPDKSKKLEKNPNAAKNKEKFYEL